MKRIFFFSAILLFTSTVWSQVGPSMKSFSWKGLSINYPDNYTIIEKEYDRQNKSHNFICTTTEDKVSMVTVSFLKNLAKDISSSLDRKIFFNEIIPNIVSEVSSSLDSLKTSDVKEFPIAFPNVYADYTAIIENIDVQGRIVVFIQKESIITCILITESSQYMQELDNIIKTITVK